MDRECFRYFQLWFVEFDTITKQVFPSIASYISETAHIFFVNTTVIRPLPTGFFKLTPPIPIIASSFMWNLIASAFDRQQRAISWPFFPGQSRIFFVRAGFKLSGTESSSLEYPDYLFDVKNSYSQQYFHSGGFRYYFCKSGFLQMDVNHPYCSLINFWTFASPIFCNKVLCIWNGRDSHCKAVYLALGFDNLQCFTNICIHEQDNKVTVRVHIIYKNP